MSEATEGRVLYLVRRGDSGVYERLTRKEIDKGISKGEIEERSASDWVLSKEGRFVFSDDAKEYVRVK